MTEISTFLVAETEDGRRLDQYLAEHSESLSRTRVHDLILAGRVHVGGRLARPSYRLQPGDEIRIELPVSPLPSTLVPQAMPLDIVYDDEDMLVLNKPAGIAVHPAPGHWDWTLVHGLLARYPALPGIGGEQRPGIVHRLDMDTSGLLMVAKSERGLASLSSQLAARTVKKGYLALVKGEPPNREGLIDAPIARDPVQRQRMAIVAAGREARTRYVQLGALAGHTLLLAMPETGRTHQIRVHFASIGHPIAGDRTYGDGAGLLTRQFLHAALLRFARPADGAPVELAAPLPDDLLDALRSLVQSTGIRATGIGGAEAGIDAPEHWIEQMLGLSQRRFRGDQIDQTPGRGPKARRGT